MNKYTSRVSKYNNKQIVEKHAWHFKSNDFHKKYVVSVKLRPSSGEHINVCENTTSNEREYLSIK